MKLELATSNVTKGILPVSGAEQAVVTVHMAFQVRLRSAHEGSSEWFITWSKCPKIRVLSQTGRRLQRDLSIFIGTERA